MEKIENAVILTTDLQLLSILNTINDRLILIESRLLIIEEKIGIINNSTKNMDEHINFVNSVYENIKNPFYTLFNTISSISNNNLEYK